MNILFLSTESPYPPDHGHHLRSFNVLKLLANQHKVFFLGFAKTEKELNYKKELERYCETVDLLLLPSGRQGWQFFRSLFLNLFSPLPFTVQRYIQRAAKTRIQEIIEQNKIDLVHVDMLHLGIYYKAFQQLPKIIVNHNVEYLRMLRWAKLEKKLFLKLYLFLQFLKLYFYEKKICSKFDMCNVVSDYDKAVLLKISPNTNFITIPNGVDISYFKPTNGECVDSNSLVWVGGMRDPNNKKAVNYFLEEILPLIQAKIPGVEVTFVGGAPTSQVIKKAEEHSNIKVAGYVDDVRPYMQRALVFFAPLLSGSGTKLKVLNALSMAKAVVTTSIGAEGIDVVNNENIFIANDANTFAEKIIYLLQNPEIAQQLGEKARKVVEEKYDWKIIGQKMFQAYHELRQSYVH